MSDYDENYSQDQLVSFKSEDNASTLQLRLDTKKLRDDIEKFLRNYDYVVDGVDSETGEEKIKKVYFDEPLANDKGVAGILHIITTIINNHVVQGNYKTDEYRDYLYGVRTDIADILMDNLYKWGIKEEDYNFIIDTLMFTVKPFLSRTLYDGERKSYSQSLRTNETNTINKNSKKSFFGI